MTPLQQLIYDSISEIQSMKRDGGKAPDLATMRELDNSIQVEIKESINQLVRNGLIIWHKDINGNLMFGVNNEQSM